MTHALNRKPPLTPEVLESSVVDEVLLQRLLRRAGRAIAPACSRMLEAAAWMANTPSPGADHGDGSR